MRLTPLLPHQGGGCDPDLLAMAFCLGVEMGPKVGHTPRLRLSVRSLGLVGEKGSSFRSELVHAVPPPISWRKAVFPQASEGTPAHTSILAP